MDRTNKSPLAKDNAVRTWAATAVGHFYGTAVSSIKTGLPAAEIFLCSKPLRSYTHTPLCRAIPYCCVKTLFVLRESKDVCVAVERFIEDRSKLGLEHPGPAAAFMNKAMEFLVNVRDNLDLILTDEADREVAAAAIEAVGQRLDGITGASIAMATSSI